MQKVQVRLAQASAGPAGGAIGDAKEVGALEAARMLTAGQIQLPDEKTLAVIKAAVQEAEAAEVETAEGGADKAAADKAAADKAGADKGGK